MGGWGNGKGRGSGTEESKGNIDVRVYVCVCLGRSAGVSRVYVGVWMYVWVSKSAWVARLGMCGEIQIQSVWTCVWGGLGVRCKRVWVWGGVCVSMGRMGLITGKEGKVQERA